MSPPSPEMLVSASLVAGTLLLCPLERRKAAFTREKNGGSWNFYRHNARCAYRNDAGTRLTEYQAGRISFAEFDASVRGWVNHVRYADTWGLRRHMFAGLRFTMAPNAAPGASRP